MPKLQFHRGRFSVSVPTEIVKKRNWKKGDDLSFTNITFGDGGAFFSTISIGEPTELTKGEILECPKCGNIQVFGNQHANCLKCGYEYQGENNDKRT